MDDTNQNSSSRASAPRLIIGCPYLGVREDAETHFSTATLGNYCHKVNPSQSVSIEQQEGFCLSGLHHTCIIYDKSWEGALPEGIRGDGPNGFRKTKPKPPVAPPKKPIDPTPIIDDPPVVEALVLTNEASIPIEEPGDIGNDTELDGSIETPWAKLHEEARDHLGETSSKSRDKIIWSIIFLLASFVLAISVIGLFRQFNNQSKGIVLTGNAALILTSTQQAFQGSQDMTSTSLSLINSEAELTKKNSPTPDGYEETRAVELGLTSTAEAIILLEPSPTIVSCEDFTGYPIEILSGPDLSPRPGFIYDPSLPEPIIQAKWTIRNLGNCSWNQISLVNNVTGEAIVPIIMQDGDKVDFNDPTQAIQPNETVELILAFFPADANSIDSDWVLQINNFSLDQQSHLVLKIADWVIIIQSTSTPTYASKPTTIPKTATPGGPSRSTPTPPKRITEKPPTRSP
jgi:hypothetical protein